MSDDVKARAIGLYKAPFRYERGYIWDANGNMVADRPAEDDGTTLRVRGWGRIGYMPDAPALQDAVGEHIAKLLTEHWTPKAHPIHTTPPTIAALEKHAAVHGPWLRVKVCLGDAAPRWHICHASVLGGHVRALIPDTGWYRLEGGLIVQGFQWSDSDGLPVPGPEGG